MTRLRNRLATLLLCSGIAGCGDPGVSAGKPTVAVSVLPLAYIVDQLSSDLVQTVVMLPPGASPSQYQPTMGQLRALADASLYVKIGHPNFPFEAAWLDRLLEGAPGVAVVDTSGGLSDLADDPHIWLAPERMGAMSARVADALAAILPAHAEELTTNLLRLQGEIRALDREIRETFEPALARGSRPAFLVQHPAWGHFARAYGLEQVAVEQHHRQPDPHALAQRIRWARQHGIRVIFVQPQIDPTPAETVAAEIGAQVVQLDPLAYDWAANLRGVAIAVSEGLSQ